MFVTGSTAVSVDLVELVEHPGGKDGGTFPQRHEFTLSAEGVLYTTSFPDDPSGTFCDGEPDDFIKAKTKQEATTLLKQKVAELEQHLTSTKTLLAVLESPSSTYFVGFDGGGDDEDC